MVVCTAPGKVILFGEHAVVYGEPAVALAIDKRITCDVEIMGDKTTVNGREISERYHSYILKAVERVGFDDELKIETKSEIPSGAGLGSSASITVAMISALLELKGEPGEEEVARNSFEVEYEVQGSASPIDTSTVTHGKAVMLSDERRSNFLWNIEKDGNSWNIHDTDIPEMQLVIGDTGVHAATGPLVKKVRTFYEKSNFAKEVVNDIGDLVREGCRALERGDLERVGELMNKNHKLLSILGVSHPKLDALVKAASSYSYGAKLTGAGGGGSMVALTDEPEKVAEAIERRGGTPYIVNSTKNGSEVVRE